LGLTKRTQGNQFLDAADAVRHTPAPTVELPNQDCFEAMETRVAQQAVEFRAARQGTAAARIYILCKDLPATPGDILAQFMKLHLAALVGGADAGVEGDDHGCPMNAPEPSPSQRKRCKKGLISVEKPLKNV
jgi:hypothetical protein